jgi:hypothetical protein
MIFDYLVVPALVLSFLVPQIESQDMELKQSEVPALVMNALLRGFPKAVVLNWSKKTVNAMTTYEAAVTEGSRSRDVVFSEDGRLVAVERAIQVANLPDRIKKAIQVQYPDAALCKAEKIGGNGKTQYMVEILKGSRKKLLLNSKGKILKEE